MNRFACLSCILLLFGVSLNHAQASWLQGELVVVTSDNVNTGAAATGLKLTEYAYNPATGQFGLPSYHPIAGLVLSAENDHEGLLQLSTDGKSLTFGGYQAAPGTANVIASGAPRAIGVVDAGWNLTTTTISGYAGVALRSVASTDGKHFWTGGDQGASGGQYYVDASGPLTQTLLNSNDARGNRIDHGQLWSVSSSIGGGSKIGTGLPTTAATSTLVMNSGTVKSDLVFLDFNNDGISELAYSTDGKNVIGKWSFDGTNWSLTGTYTGTKTSINDINSLQVFVFNGKVQLLAATQLGQIFRWEDANNTSPGFGPAFASTTPSPFIQLGAGQSFRGMAIVPEPTSLTLFALAIPFLAWRCRSRVRRCES